MIKKILISIVALLSLMPVSMDAKKVLVPYTYELEHPGDSYMNTSVGWKTLKVWSFGKKEIVTANICCRNAVHGVIFKGASFAKLQPLCPDGYEAHKQYFDEFFENESNYLQFVEATNKGMMQAGDVIKWGKEYKIGLLVKVNINALRAKLVKDGIVAGVDDIFGK